MMPYNFQQIKILFNLESLWNFKGFHLKINTVYNVVQELNESYNNIKHPPNSGLINIQHGECQYLHYGTSMDLLGPWYKYGDFFFFFYYIGSLMCAYCIMMWWYQNYDQ